MRTTTDALRSLAKYVATTLSPQPVLGELWWTDGGSTTLRWTTNGMVAGDVEVDFDSWGYLREQDRHAPLAVTGPDGPYLSSQLVNDPRAGAPAGVNLNTGLTVVEGDLPVMPEFEVRFAADPGTFTPPFARVLLTGPAIPTGPAMLYEVAAAFQVEAYPVPLGYSDDGTILPEDVEHSVLSAVGVMDALERGFRRQGFDAGRPIRVPLYDYDGVPLEEAATVRNPSDYMRVADFSTRLLPDPLDPRRQAVMCDVRLAWKVAVDQQAVEGRLSQPVRGTRLVESVTVQFDAS